tara:strand:- start:479 stop:637 length:159 start_codon:yes stop_codon:yes gene_type:complete
MPDLQIDEDTIGVLVDMAFMIHHDLDGKIPFEFQPFKDELQVLLDTLCFTIH